MTAAALPVFVEQPFLGLRNFDETDSLLFFGRREQTEDLLRRLDEMRFLAVVGLSGSGKSSLVRAGLIPALLKGDLPGAGARWLRAVMRPGADPFAALASALNQPDTLGPDPLRLETLRASSFGLIHASRTGRSGRQNLLVLVDQFEEIFRNGSHDAADFVRLLLTAAEESQPEYRIYIVITLRSDYLGECAQFRDLPEMLNRSQYLVPRMTEIQWRQAIESPAALGGAEIDPALLQQLLIDAGDDPDQLPALQHLLMRMWQHRDHPAVLTLEDYKRAGRWGNALNRHAEQELSGIARHQKLAKRIFQRLTAKGDRNRESRRPTPLHELAEVAGASIGDVKAVVEHFRRPGCNFLTSPDGMLTENSIIDITHESLIRRWATLKEWAEQEARWAEWYRDVERRRERYSNKEGGLLREPDLTSVLRAQTDGQWSSAWARRYTRDPANVEPEYRRVAEYIARSKAQRAAEERRRRAILIGAVLAALIFAVLAWISYGAFQRASSAEAQVRGQNEDIKAKQEKLAAANQKLQEQARALATALTTADSEKRKAEAAKILADAEKKNAEGAAVEARNSADKAEQERVKVVAANKQASDAQAKAEAAAGAAQRSADAEKEAKEEASTSLKTTETLLSLSLWRNRWNQGAALLDVKPEQAFRDVNEGVFLLFASRQLLTRDGLDAMAKVLPASLFQKRLDSAFFTASRTATFTSDGHLITAESNSLLPFLTEITVSMDGNRKRVTTGKPDAVALSGDGKLLFIGKMGALEGIAKRLGIFGRGYVYVYDVATGKELHRLQTNRHPLTALVSNEDGSLMASSSAIGTRNLYEVNRDHRRWKHPRLGWFGVVALGNPAITATALAFSPRSDLLAAALEDGAVELWNTPSGRASTIQAHADAVTSVAFSSDGNKLITTSRGGTAKIWNLSDRAHPAQTLQLTYTSRPNAHDDAVLCSAFGDGDRLIATGGQDRVVRLWNGDGKFLLELRSSREYVVGLRFDHTGKRLVAIGSDGAATIWDLSKLAEVLRVKGEIQKLIAAARAGFEDTLIPPPNTKQVLGDVVALQR